VGDEYRYREIFVPDSGALLDIFVFDVTEHHWQSLLSFLSTNYELKYLEDGVVQPLPELTEIWQRADQTALTLQVILPGFTANTFFFCRDQIELDVLPEDVTSAEKADAVFKLMKGLALTLDKEVFMVQEHGSARDEELRKMAICSCNPSNLEIRM
jgi:hypothetical protein